MTDEADTGTHDYGLGRIPSPPDPRDRAHPMRAFFSPRAVTLPPYKHWPTGPILNQGDTPHCVGFAWAQWEMTSPVRIPLATSRDGNALGHGIYASCKEIDGYAGDGTWVRAGASVMKTAGRLASYVWATGPNDLRDWVLLKGPVVVGTDWHESMFDPDARGWMRPAGAVVGGHAYLVTGYNANARAYRVTNSWGTGWGDNGKAWILAADLWRLVSQSGEAVAAPELPR